MGNSSSSLLLCWRRRGWGEEGGLEGEARLANLFSVTVMVQVATEQSLDDPAHSCSTLGFEPRVSAQPKAVGTGTPRTLSNQRGRDGEETLGTSKTGSFALYSSLSIPRPETAPALGEISVTAWSSRSLGSMEKDKITAKPQMGGAVYMLSEERAECEPEQSQRGHSAWSL